MVPAFKLAFAAALLPASLACNGYTGGVPTPTSTKTNSKVIEIATRQTYDGGWARFDQGSGACSGQSEEDTSKHVLPTSILLSLIRY